jgi:chromosome partitioning protein
VLGGHKAGTLALRDVIRTLDGGPDLAPADIAMASNELGLIQRLDRVRILAKALATVSGQYDHVLIDCPPNLGTLTINGLVAADRVIVPTVADYLSVRGLVLFLDTLQTVRAELNPGLVVLGVLLTFHDPRLVLAQDIVALLEQQGIPLLSVQVRRSVRVAEAALAHAPVSDYDPGHPAAVAYAELARVVDEE